MQSPPVTSTGQIDHTREASNEDNVQFNENCNVLTHTQTRSVQDRLTRNWYSYSNFRLVGGALFREPDEILKSRLRLRVELISKEWSDNRRWCIVATARFHTRFYSSTSEYVTENTTSLFSGGPTLSPHITASGDVSFSMLLRQALSFPQPNRLNFRVKENWKLPLIVCFCDVW